MSDLFERLIRDTWRAERRVAAVEAADRQPTRPIWLTTPLTSVDWTATAKSGADGVLDLSALFGVPAYATAVYVRFVIKDEGANVGAGLGPDVTNSDAIYARTQVANIATNQSGWVPCDANGDIYFAQTGELDEVTIKVYGYWLQE